MTGRGRGFCGGNAVPGKMNSGRGSGIGMGRGGRGGRNQFHARGANPAESAKEIPPASANRQQEIAALQTAIGSMLTTLNETRKRIEQLGVEKPSRTS